MPSAAEEGCKPSGNCHRISHSLESGHPVDSIIKVWLYYMETSCLGMLQVIGCRCNDMYPMMTQMCLWLWQSV